MAEGQRMTVADVVAQVRDGRLEDFVREAVAIVAGELMEAEIAAEIGAERGEVAPGARVTHRNGYRPRPWETRVGEIELLIPRKRQGSYFPSFLEPRRRSEQAIVAVVLEAHVNGVSTRKVDRLVEQLGVEGMTKDRVSEMCRGLDEQVELFRRRPLEGADPYLWLDAKHVKVRDHGRVVSKALVVAYAVHETGLRELIGHVLERLQAIAPKVCRLLEDAEEDLIAFYQLPSEHWTKLRSTNPLERVNKEIGRRSDVVGIFPNDASVIRLAGALLAEQNDERLVQRRYLSAESMQLILSAERTEEDSLEQQQQ